MLHISKPNISFITYSRHGNQKLTQKGQQKYVFNKKKIKHPLTFGHSIFLDSRWIVGESRFLSMLCTWIFPIMKQHLQVTTFQHTQWKGKKNEMGNSPLLTILLLPTLQYRCISINQGGESWKGSSWAIIGKTPWSKRLCSPSFSLPSPWLEVCQALSCFWPLMQRTQWRGCCPQLWYLAQLVKSS